MLLDVRGEICPYPMLKAVEALPRLKEGEALEVLTDHAPALQTIPAYTGRLGYATRIEEVGPGTWKVVVYKPAASAAAGAPAAASPARGEVSP
ncbi:MAG TPA: sulfurtransferase TusA family protein [Limnochordales bacterium]